MTLFPQIIRGLLIVQIQCLLNKLTVFSYVSPFEIKWTFSCNLEWANIGSYSFEDFF